MKNFVENFTEGILGFLKENQMAIISFFIVLIVGYLILRIGKKIINRSIDRSKLNDTLSGFLKGFISIFINLFYMITLLSSAGIPMTSFIAIFSAAGLAVALALQGNLSNFASGIMIVFFKPFQVGDFIETQGVIGTVKEIQILYTHLLTPDNKKVIVPNTDLTSKRVVNFTSEATRRIDMVFGVAYESDVEEVKTLLREIAWNHDMILKEPEPVIRLTNHGDNSLDFDMKLWVAKENYWAVYYDVHEQVKARFDEVGITIPFPQRVVHVAKEV